MLGYSEGARILARAPPGSILGICRILKKGPGLGLLFFYSTLGSGLFTKGRGPGYWAGSSDPLLGISGICRC